MTLSLEEVKLLAGALAAIMWLLTNWSVCAYRHHLLAKTVLMLTQWCTYRIELLTMQYRLSEAESCIERIQWLNKYLVRLQQTVSSNERCDVKDRLARVRELMYECRKVTENWDED